VTLAPTAEAALPDRKIDYLVKIETGEVHPWPHQPHVTIGLSASGQSVRFHLRAEAEEFARHPNRAQRIEEMRPIWDAAREKHKAWWASERERLAADEATRRAAERAEWDRRREALSRAKRQESARRAALTRRYRTVLRGALIARHGVRRISWLGHVVASNLSTVADALVLERAQHILGSLSEPDAIVRLARERAQEIQSLRASRRSHVPGTTLTLEGRLHAYLLAMCSEHISAACTRYLPSTPTYEIRLGAEPAVAYASSPIWPRYYSRRRYPIGHEYTVTVTVPRSWLRNVFRVLGSAVVQGHVVLDLQPTDRPQLYAATWLRKSRGYEPALVRGYVTWRDGLWMFAELEPVPLSSWERLTDTPQPEPRVRTRKGAAKGTPLKIIRAAALPTQSAALQMPSALKSGGRRIRVLDLDG
jgi:hypothetical protein